MKQYGNATAMQKKNMFARTAKILIVMGSMGAAHAHATATNCPAAAQGIYNVCAYATAGAGTSASPWTGWESGINGLSQNKEIYFPAGVYQQSSTIVAQKGWVLRGAGMQASLVLSTLTSGDMIRWGSSSTINTTASAYLSIRDLWLASPSNASAQSAAIDILGGTYVNIKNVSTGGFGIGIVLNQAEIVDIEDCDFEGTLSTSVAGIYLVNGNYNPSLSGISMSAALPDYTNRISIYNNQFNGGNSTYVGVYDEGGGGHSIRDNNFNAGGRAIYIGGITAVGLIEGNAIEGTQLEPIYVVDNMPNENWASYSNGDFVRASHDLSIRHNSISIPNNINKSSILFAPNTSGHPSVYVWTASITDNEMVGANVTVPSFSGVAYTAGLVAYANFNGYNGTPVSEAGYSVTSETHGYMSISTSSPINGNSSTNPSVGTFYLYVGADNKLHAKGSNGTDTTVANP